MLSVNAEEANMQNNLESLIAAHVALMVPFEAAYDDDAGAAAQEALYPQLLATRQALLDHRPASLDEVKRKAEFMAKDRSFAFWDDDAVEITDIIAALTPAGDAVGLRDAA